MSMTENPEPEDLARMRRGFEEELPAAKQRGDLLALENFGLRAGIDLTTRQGQSWAATAPAEVWEDPEAAKSDYLSMFPASSSVEETETVQEEPAPTSEELHTGMTQDLRDNQQGSYQPPGTTPPEDPYENMFSAVEEAKANRAPEDNARQRGLESLMQAAANGDSRVIWTEEKKDEWMENAPW